MSDDVVTRLRQRGHLASDGAAGSDGHYRPQTFIPDALCSEAANVIEHLTQGWMSAADIESLPEPQPMQPTMDLSSYEFRRGRKLKKVSPTTADGLLRLALAIERLAGAIERHR